MYAILAYDVGKPRAKKVLQTCRRYLTHVQNSVFEGNITEGKLKKLQKELDKILNSKEDTCSIYLINNTKYVTKESIGMVIDPSNDIISSE